MHSWNVESLPQKFQIFASFLPNFHIYSYDVWGGKKEKEIWLTAEYELPWESCWRINVISHAAVQTISTAIHVTDQNLTWNGSVCVFIIMEVCVDPHENQTFPNLTLKYTHACDMHVCMTILSLVFVNQNSIPWLPTMSYTCRYLMYMYNNIIEHPSNIWR